MKDMTETEYKQLLSETYQGTVTLISRYSTVRATSVFKCSKCEKEFFNRASHMVGSFDGFHHLCGQRYASDTNSRKEGGIKRHKKKKAESL